ncbi:hypothetical protein B0H67DRAFT_644892 [Lasiosphaeris hirsuta]|uniref:Uncharacterized protein n=1 Tax=Lasiosphaeris hirsuta TaxID=260670 RepID=A0AA40AFW8_9PEZI|nr:hypothetical protein B0H67DRAFT_644892 [Lasiosphaeris hirsuta]
MCDNFDGPNAPFCSPTPNQQLTVGRTFEVTWDPNYFNSTEVPMVRVQADFGVAPSANLLGGADGFTSELINVSTGRFTWNILADYLAAGFASTPARIFLEEPSLTNETTRGLRTVGPRVELVSSTGRPLRDPPPPPPPAGSVDNGPVGVGANPIAIVLPVVFGVLTLVLLGGCVWFRRRHPDFGRGWFTFRRGGRWRGGAGYGVGRSKSQRVRGQDIKVINTDINGLRMNAMAMNGDRDRNIFREEMRRQERFRF